MSKANDFLKKLSEAPPSDKEKLIAKVLGVSLPDDWGDEKEVDVEDAAAKAKRQKERDDLEATGRPDWEPDKRHAMSYLKGPNGTKQYYQEGDFNNVNWCKKFIYDQSLKAEGHDRDRLQKMVVHAFDGRFMRGVFIVYGSTKIFPIIAETMRKWNSEHKSNRYDTRAVLVNVEGESEPRLIWLNGKNMNQPFHLPEPDEEMGWFGDWNDPRVKKELEKITHNDQS